MDSYIFYLKTNEDGAFKKVKPTWGDSHSRQRSRMKGRRIVRDEIGEEFRFMSGQGFETVRDGSIENVYFVNIYEVVDNTEVIYFQGEFTVTDCKFDLDQEFFTVVLTPNDQYTEYIEQEDTEHDLLKLGTSLTSVKYFAYPLLQLYALGSSTVLNVQPGGSYERQVERINAASFGGTLTLNLGFGPSYSTAYIPFIEGMSPDVSGYYLGTSLGNQSIYRRLDGAYDLRYETDFQNSPDPDEVFFSEWRLTEVDGNALIFLQEDADSSNPKFYSRGLEMLRVGEPEQKIVVAGMDLFARVISRQPTFNGVQGENIVVGDQFAAGTTYKYSYPIELDTLIASVETSEADEGLGRYAEDGTGVHAGGFVKIPDSPGADQLPVFPISRGQWKDVAWFFYWDEVLLEQIRSAGEQIDLTDAFKISDVIKTVIQSIDPRLQFEPLSEFSQFLFDDVNPVTGDSKTTYLIAPKSNVITYNYERPASKAPIKMNDLVELLRVCFQAEAFITEDFKFRIETEAYFENGETYDAGDPGFGIDLTTLIEAKTKEAWSWKTNKYEFIKSDIPERIIFSWMDPSSDAFLGEDIVALSRYAQRGQKEERKISNFSADLQLAVSQPSGFSTEGFFLLAAKENEDGELVVIEADVPGYGPTQNGSVSFPYLHNKFYRVNMPTVNYRMNNVEVTAISTRPTRKQTVTAPVPRNLSVFLLGRTELRAGFLESISENMTTKVADIEIASGTN